MREERMALELLRHGNDARVPSSIRLILDSGEDSARFDRCGRLPQGRATLGSVGPVRASARERYGRRMFPQVREQFDRLVST